MNKLIIGTRGSKLALWQAQWVKERMGRLRPGLLIELQVIKTEADQRHELSPEAFGREGIFTAELDRALQGRRIDAAVHSLKDLPTRLAPGLALAAVTERGPVADVFILRGDHAKDLDRPGDDPELAALARMEKDIVVGTSSLRRTALLKHYFPRLRFAPMRGNLDTRLKKLEAKEVDAIVVAEAGLTRLGIKPEVHLVIPLPPDRFLPAAGQGALAVETREDDPGLETASVLDHQPTRACVSAERTAMSALGAGCRVPAGFMALLGGDKLTLYGAIAHPRGEPLIRAEVQGESKDPEAMGNALADKLLEMGAARVLHEVKG